MYLESEYLIKLKAEDTIFEPLKIPLNDMRIYITNDRDNSEVRTDCVSDMSG